MKLVIEKVLRGTQQTTLRLHGLAAAVQVREGIVH